MEAYTISERKYKLKPQSESHFPVIILYSSINQSINQPANQSTDRSKHIYFYRKLRTRFTCSLRVEISDLRWPWMTLDDLELKLTEHFFAQNMHVLEPVWKKSE